MVWGASLCAILALTACGAHEVLVSRGTSVPQELQVMSEDQLFEYYKVKEEKGYKDGSSLMASVVMVDMAYLKATGQTLEASEEEMDALSRLKRFEVHLEYRTPNILPAEGENEAAGMAFEKWNVSLRDSTGAQVSPESKSFDPPVLQKQATDPDEAFDNTSRLILTYILKGQLIFEYQIPEGCKWVEIEFAPPQTGHIVATRWTIIN